MQSFPHFEKRPFSAADTCPADFTIRQNGMPSRTLPDRNSEIREEEMRAGPNVFFRHRFAPFKKEKH